MRTIRHQFIWLLGEVLWFRGKRPEKSHPTSLRRGVLEGVKAFDWLWRNRT